MGPVWGPDHNSDPKAEPAFPEAGGQRENPCGVWGAQRDGRAPNWGQCLRGWEPLGMGLHLQVPSPLLSLSHF